MTQDQKIRALRVQIKSKKAIEFTYLNDKEGTRIGNPHTLGISQDKYAVRIYQTGGTSSSGLLGKGSPEDFRFFFLEDIDKIVELRTTFEVNPSFKSGDKSFEKIDIEVKK